MSKKKNQEIHKLYCIAQLLLESLDELKPTSAKMKKFKEDLIGLFFFISGFLFWFMIFHFIYKYW